MLKFRLFSYIISMSLLISAHSLVYASSLWGTLAVGSLVLSQSFQTSMFRTSSMISRPLQTTHLELQPFDKQLPIFNSNETYNLNILAEYAGGDKQEESVTPLDTYAKNFFWPYPVTRLDMGNNGVINSMNITVISASSLEERVLFNIKEVRPAYIFNNHAMDMLTDVGLPKQIFENRTNVFTFIRYLYQTNHTYTLTYMFHTLEQSAEPLMQEWVDFFFYNAARYQCVPVLKYIMNYSDCPKPTELVFTYSLRHALVVGNTSTVRQFKSYISRLNPASTANLYHKLEGLLDKDGWLYERARRRRDAIFANPPPQAWLLPIVQHPTNASHSNANLNNATRSDPKLPYINRPHRKR